jgi:pyruvate dehydrogenase E2 component (dihydrolipoamide acetyltransferase)
MGRIVATPIYVPPASISMEQVRIVQWLVEDGNQVTAGQPVVEVETDKSVIEVEAPASGLLRQLAPNGADLAVDAILAEVVDATDSGRKAGSEPEGSPDTTPRPAGEQVDVTATPVAVQRRGRNRATPAARTLAARHGVDLGKISGTGPEGRVTAEDVMRAAAAIGAADVEKEDKAATEEPRAAAVRAILASWQTVPHIHIGGELEVEGLVAYRSCLVGEDRPSVTDLLVFALARALQVVPELNALVRRDGTIARASGVDCAIATATAHGLETPVIRRAETLSISEISQVRKQIVSRARGGRREAGSGGPASVTLSNLGMYPVDFFTPVINSPQVALVATGRVRQHHPAAGGSAISHRMWANVAIDHRAADGEAGGRLLAALEQVFAEMPTFSQRS